MDQNNFNILDDIHAPKRRMLNGLRCTDAHLSSLQSGYNEDLRTNLTYLYDQTAVVALNDYVAWSSL